MGFNKIENKLFVNVSKGVFVYQEKEKDETTGKEGFVKKQDVSYTGTIERIYRKEDEFEGKKVKKIVVEMQDNTSPTVAVIQFAEKGYYALGFFDRIRKVDVFKPITLGVSGSKESEKMSFCWMRQFGEKETVKKDDNFVKPRKIDADTTDWSACMDEYTEIINDINGKLTNSKPDAIHEEPKGKFSSSAEEIEELPF